MNLTILSGHIGSPPEHDTTKNGHPKAKVSLFYKNNGKEQDKSNKNVITCYGYKGVAEVIQNHIGTGDEVLFQGELNHINYKTPEGQWKNYTTMTIHRIKFIDLKRNREEASAPPVFSGEEINWDGTK
tara:strand:+ start:566 stop:949 length:384 start_codon:yes stop_codon:yes gene_type:complete